MTEDQPHITLQCPICTTGVVDSQTGTAQHTPTDLQWVGVTCTHCHRSFTYRAGRAPVALPSPLVGESTFGA